MHGSQESQEYSMDMKPTDSATFTTISRSLARTLVEKFGWRNMAVVASGLWYSLGSYMTGNSTGMLSTRLSVLEYDSLTMFLLLTIILFLRLRKTVRK